MITCLQCNKEILSQKQFLTQICDNAIIEGSSHLMIIKELQSLPKVRTVKI